MSFNTFLFILHLGQFIKAGGDLKSTIGDLTKGVSARDDAAKLFTDLEAIVNDGIFTVPGMTAAQMTQALEEMKAVLGPQAPPVAGA